MRMTCPQCGHQQSSTLECEQCGIIFAKFKPHEAPPKDDVRLPTPLEALLRDANVLRLNESPRDGLSVITDWEPARTFDIVDSVGRSRGTAAEQGRGFLAGVGRTFFSAWLPVRFEVFTYPAKDLALTLTRPFFWYFSQMIITGPRGQLLGSAVRRFSLIRRRYELRDSVGRTFATIVSPLLHPWTFPVFDRTGQQRAEITKRWAGMTEEIVTGEQKFRVDFMNHDWPLAQRAVILAAALSIDFDAFESRRSDKSFEFGLKEGPE
jgi:Scramblase